MRRERARIGSVLSGPEPRWTYAEAEAGRLLWPRERTHDLDWKFCKGRFFADLHRVGLKYDDLAAWCEARWGRHPSEDRILRNSISQSLLAVAAEVAAWRDAPSNNTLSTEQ